MPIMSSICRTHHNHFLVTVLENKTCIKFSCSHVSEPIGLLNIVKEKDADIHVNIPLVGRCVVKAPTSCILRCHYTSIQPTQHGHHVVLDGPCNCKILKKLGSGKTMTIIRVLSWGEEGVGSRMQWLLKQWANLNFMYQKIVAQPNPVAILR